MKWLGIVGYDCDTSDQWRFFDSKTAATRWVHKTIKSDGKAMGGCVCDETTQTFQNTVRCYGYGDMTNIVQESTNG